MHKIILVHLLLLLFGVQARAQPDSLLVDSVLKRIEAILEEYNAQVLYVDTVEYVTEGWDVDDINLQIASSKGACNEIIRLYVKGADVNNFAGKTATPLHYAVSSGRKEAVEILLLLGAQPDKPDMYGNSPLVSAVRSNSLEIAELLIRYGASLTIADRFNSTPLHHAAALGYFYIADMLLYYEAPTELRDNEGNTPLMTGVSFGYYDISDILLRSGADPNVPDKKGFTPLMAAAQNADTLMMRLLVGAGANLYHVNNSGLDVLGCAVMSGSKEAVEFLLDTGNRWDYSDGQKNDPVKMANSYGNKSIIQMMLDRGMSEKREFALDELSISAGGMFTTHYQMATVSVSLTDPRLRTGLSLGASFNPSSQRLLIRGDEDIVYQYRVSSTVIYAGLFREFRLSRQASVNTWSFVPSLSAGYRFYSRYSGTNDKPEDKFCIMPSAEFRWGFRQFHLGSGITYLNTPFYKVLPLWFTLNASFTLTGDTKTITGKKIRLYNYE
ncbi:MAG: ankyrin repeat domain-containing protein [Bacteroidales bacterium]|nr:ankyrin repeat domain-containing protein [Bacteroidales bacterium]